MNRFLIQIAIVLTGFLVYPQMGCAEERGISEGKTLSFGVYTHIRATEMLKKMEPLRKYLEEAMARKGFSHPIRMRIYPTYSKAIEALATGKVDFVRFGPVSYILAKKKNPAIQLLAMESNNGKKQFCKHTGSYASKCTL